MAGLVPVKIGLIGAADCSERGWDLAVRVGALVAERKAVLICGGLGGVMEAGAKGAFEAGGLTIGFLPGTSDRDANPYIVIPLSTGMMQARNLLIVRASDALIAVEGGYGTLSEIGLALNQGKTVVGLDTWQHIPGVHHAEDPEDAVTKAFNSLETSDGKSG